MRIEATEIREVLAFCISEDYKQRFIGEYWELKIRHEKLHKMILKKRSNMLDFKTDCPDDLLIQQLQAMQQYLNALELRAEIEGIDVSLKVAEKPKKEPEVVEVEQVKATPKKRSSKPKS